jgi:DNA polymerase-3 subunit beta
MTVESNRLALAATNLEMSIITRVPANVETHGSISVPARLLADVVGGLPNEPVTLRMKGASLRLECGRFVNNIAGLDADEFTRIPTITKEGISFPAPALRDAIECTAFAAATDESRPVLTGVYVGIGPEGVKLAAADGFRLAKYVLGTESMQPRPDLIIPARAMRELANIIGDAEGAIKMATGDNQVVFETGATTLVSRLIDGQFPGFEKIIPEEHATRCLVDTRELAKAVKLASHFALASQGILKVQVQEKEGLTLSANAADVGDNQGTIGAMIEGRDNEIAVNVRFLADVLEAIETQQVALELMGAHSPLVLRPVGDDRYTHVIMPMSMR